MIVDDLDVLSPERCPSEHDAILVVDSNAVLAFPVAFQRFELVARRNVQQPQFVDRIDLLELAPRDAPDLVGAKKRDGDEVRIAPTRG